MTPAEEFRALSKDKRYPKPFRDYVGMHRIPELTERPLQIVQAVADLRSLVDRFPAQKDVLRAFLTPLEARCNAQGWKIGSTLPEAQQAVIIFLTGGWVEETDQRAVRAFLNAPDAEARAKLPPLPEVVLGGFMVPDYYTAPEPEPEPEVPTELAGKSRLFQILSGAPQRRSVWERYLDNQEPEHLARLGIVRRVLEQQHRELLGARAPSRWEQFHHFAFLEHPPLSFSARAWGDLQVAIAGKGHYLDYYA